MSKKIVILTGRSLFTAGLISKLQNSPSTYQIVVVNMCEPDPGQKIVEADPEILLLDETDPEFTGELRENLLKNFPRLKIILLDPHKNQLRVMQMDVHDNSQIWDLLNEVKASGISHAASTAGLDNEAKKLLNINLNA